jgi:F-type H+-transporting ATPase subunit b
MLNWWGLGSAYKENPAIGWMLLTFGVFIFLIRHFVRKPLGEFLQARSAGIKNAIEEGRLAREEAAAKLAQYERRLLELDAEIARLKADFAHQGELEKAKLKLEAEKVAAQMMKDAEQTLKAEVSRALHELKAEIALKLMDSAKASLGGKADLDAGLLKNFSADVQESRV